MNDLTKLAKALSRRGISCEVFPDTNGTCERVQAMVAGGSVGYGTSMTLKSLGLLDTLGQFASRVFPHVPGGASDDERGALSADFYLTSANAVSMDGQIVNIDGTGNRVGATCFGPKHVLYLIGRNKIVRTLDEAISRAKDAAVRLAEYYGRRTPCVETGRCMDCLVDDCICSVTTIHRKKPLGVDMTVFLIDQDLGL